MKRQLKVFLIILTVIAIIHIVGGAVYLATTSVGEREYTYVVCTIEEILSTPSENDTYTVQEIRVSYQNEKGETVFATLLDYPSSFSVGAKIEGRYKDNPFEISCEKTNWFYPSLVMIVGVVYAVIVIVLLAMRKKMGLYALESVEKTADLVEEDDWTIFEEIEQQQNERCAKSQKDDGANNR